MKQNDFNPRNEDYILGKYLTAHYHIMKYEMNSP